MDKADSRPYRQGVGVMLISADARVFVANRIDMNGEAWQMPQGGIDEGEDPQAAALRELDEEIGTDKAHILGESHHWLRYDLPPELAGKVWGGRYRGQEQKWYAVRFTGGDSDIDLTAHGRPEFSAWRWVTLDDLYSLVVPFKREVDRAVIAELRDYCVPA